MLEQLETPSLLLDVNKLERNCAQMRDKMKAHGVSLRPHMKTGKCVEVAREALGAATGPITVSTLREAEYFFDHGFRDILYAVGIVPGKVPRIAALSQRGARITTIVDSVEGAKALAAAGEKAGMRIPALVEIDSDRHRAGVPPGDKALVEIYEVLKEGLRGVMTHAGASYDQDSIDGIKRSAVEEREAVVKSANVLRAAGAEAPVVSVGSTPTAVFGESFEGVSEARPGVYVFKDLVMAGLGVCGYDDIAISVLASVIGHQRDKNWILVDAGWMAMSRDRGTASQKVDQGFGLVCDVDGKPVDELIVASANQEHGIVARRDGGPIDYAKYPIGSLLRILPNHACATAAQFSEYKVIRDGKLDGTWERFSGW